MLWRGGTVAVLAGGLAAGIATPASAHPYLLRSDPPSGAIVSAAPAELHIFYTEGLDRPYCSVTIVAPNGAHVSTRQVGASEPTELAVAPDHSLTATGTYAVEWTAVGDDGHTVIGSFGFSVGHPTAKPAAAATPDGTTGSASSPGGLQRLLRTVQPFVTVVFGGFLLLGGAIGAARRRAVRARAASYAVQCGITLALCGSALADGGWGAFEDSQMGRRLAIGTGLSLLAAVVVVDRGAMAAGRSPAGWRRVAGPVLAIGLLVVLAFSGHADSQPHSRRAIALAVYSLHLVAVSVWIGALIAVLLRLRPAPDQLAPHAPVRQLRVTVAISLLAVLGTGLATTDWGLRSLSDVLTTTYGALAITKLALFVAIVAVGAAAGWTRLRGARRRVGSTLFAAEAGLAVATLIVAGVLGQIAQPLDQPYASQAYASSVGLPVAVTADGSDSLVVGALAPGLVGRNTLVLEVGDSDEQDFLSPAPNVIAVHATLNCGCGLTERRARLRPTGGGAEWTGDVDLPVAASWLVTARVRRAGSPPVTVRLPERVGVPSLPDQLVVGVPTSLSGADGEACRDETLGLQVALADVNSTAADHGDLVRVVAVDLHDGVSSALARLRHLGAVMLAMPCGDQRQLRDITRGARVAGVPVVTAAATATDARTWSTQPDWRSEGAAIGRQVLRQGGRVVTAVVGDTTVDRAELSGLRSALPAGAVRLRVRTVPSRPAAWVRSLTRTRTDLVSLLANRVEAMPLAHALSSIAADSGWLPSRGIVASSQLMSTDFINDAGDITRIGGIEFASDINPFDPVSQYYAQRLRALAPGLRPSFDGLHGYEGGLVIGSALRDGGGRPSAAELTELLGERFGNFAIGSYRVGWHAAGGTSTSLAFFRSTYVNPMALPADTPGGASSLAHEGTFLDTGGFEQVAPFRTIS